MDPKLRQAKAAITQFVNDMNPRDDIFLYAFSSSPFFLQLFTTNHDLVLRRLVLLYPQGETALYDVIIDGLLMLKRGCQVRKALFVITDGSDNASGWSKEQMLNVAQRLRFPIYSMGIGDTSFHDNRNFPLFGRSSVSDSHSVDMQTLEEIAQVTGAKTYNVRETENSDQLKKEAAAIASAIGNRYAAGFVATIAGGNSLRLEIGNHPGAVVKLEGAAIAVVNVADAATPNAATH
jgi:VWFA-related protein